MKKTTADDYQRRLRRVERALEAHLDDPLSPSDLAKVAHFSLHHFHRIFRAQRGESVMQCLRRLRLERAAKAVRYSTAKLLEIALAAGYESHEAFTRAFVEQFGISPSEYRLNGEDRCQIRAPWVVSPTMHIAVIRYAEVPVFAMRGYGSYKQVGALWDRLVGWVFRQTRTLPPLYGMCPDDPDVTEESQLRFDACVASSPLVPNEEVEQLRIPAGLYAVALHQGPYQRLHETYLDLIGRWFPMSGYEPASDPVVECYVNDPRKTPEQELLTEVRVRIAEEL